MTSTIELDLSGWTASHHTALVLFLTLAAVGLLAALVLLAALLERRPLTAAVAAGLAVAMAVCALLTPRPADFTTRVEQEARISRLACPTPLKAPDTLAVRDRRTGCTWRRDGRAYSGTVTVWPARDPDRPAHVLLQGRMHGD
jgi:hypothetical protein